MPTAVEKARAQELAEKVRALAPALSESAVEADAAREVPVASLRRLRDAGMLNVLVSEALGGLGADVFSGRELLLFVAAMEELGRVDMSTAHCFQVHNHTANLLETLCPPEQAQRYLAADDLSENLGLLSWSGSEPGLTGRGMAYATIAEPVDGGYRVSGLKHYATNATAARWILVHAKRGDLPGEGDATSMQMMAIPRDAPGVEVDASAWRPMGMRACVSPVVRLDDVFVPEEDLVGEPGTYGREGLGGDVHLGFAANYIGVAQGMLEFARDRAVARRISADPHTQRMLGECHVLIASGRSLLNEAAVATADGVEARRAAAIVAKYHAMSTAEDVAQRACRISGSSALFSGEALERAVRDLGVQALHTHLDTTAQMLGLGVLELDYDRANQQLLIEPNRGGTT